MNAAQPSIAAHRGGASILALGDREQTMRRLYEDLKKDAITTDLPTVDWQGKRVFRIPRLTAFKHYYEMRPTEYASNGQATKPYVLKALEFHPGASQTYGEIVLDPKTERGRIEIGVIEDMMTDEKWSHLGLIDWVEAQKQAEVAEAEELVRKLASKGVGKRVREVAQKMGLSKALGFGDVLSQAPPAPPQ